MTGANPGYDANKVGEVAYEHAKSMLEDQQSTLASIRDRASAAMGLAGLVATFLGSAALGDEDSSVGMLWGSFSIEEWLAIAVLVMTLAGTIWLLWQRDWKFIMSPISILEQFSIEDQPALEETYLALCVFSEDNFVENQKKLDQMFIGLNVLFGLVGLQIIFWLVSLAGSS